MLPMIWELPEKISDRTAVMKDGIIVEIGKTSEIFEKSTARIHEGIDEVRKVR